MSQFPRRSRQRVCAASRGASLVAQKMVVNPRRTRVFGDGFIHFRSFLMLQGKVCIVTGAASGIGAYFPMDGGYLAH